MSMHRTTLIETTMHVNSTMSYLAWVGVAHEFYEIGISAKRLYEVFAVYTKASSNLRENERCVSPEFECVQPLSTQGMNGIALTRW